MKRKVKLRFDKEGFLSDKFLEGLEDRGAGDLTSFYGTEKSDLKTLKKLLKRLGG